MIGTIIKLARLNKKKIPTYISHRGWATDVDGKSGR